jgi:hypothetical protein
MMSLLLSNARASPPGVSDIGAKPGLIETRGREGKSGGSRLLSLAHRRIGFLGRTQT